VGKKKANLGVKKVPESAHEGCPPLKAVGRPTGQRGDHGPKAALPPSLLVLSCRRKGSCTSPPRARKQRFRWWGEVEKEDFRSDQKVSEIQKGGGDRGNRNKNHRKSASPGKKKTVSKGGQKVLTNQREKKKKKVGAQPLPRKMARFSGRAPERVTCKKKLGGRDRKRREYL